MLSCALEFKQVFPRFAQRDSNYKFLPSDDDWLRLEEVYSFLTLFNEVTNIIPDPRNKMVLINFAYQAIYTRDEAARQTGILLENLKNLYKEYLLMLIQQQMMWNYDKMMSQTVGGSSAGLLVSGRNF
ncbi:hypothetical protein COLO4_21410 [Corchorus olitorius]|uniref:Uncharacterized protein n=1 Tax=Corchorus olitorius TaxID=93759 RepID=A0A1R3ITD6_9ROSI|nr:hypothetical protein COLO4_21410 [Corchorus olitorius]